jgi:hypothetical protein
VPNHSSLSQTMEPGVYFGDVPIAMLPGWVVAVHIGTHGKPICCVMIDPDHAGASFRQDSWTWWEMHKDDATDPFPASFSPPALRLMPRAQVAASGAG